MSAAQPMLIASIDDQTFVMAAQTTDEVTDDLATPAPVQEEGDLLAGQEAIDHGEAHEEAHGIPTEIWLLLAFVVVIAIAFKPAKRAILAALDNRAERIRTELEEAQRLREEAQAALANFQRRQRDAMGEAEQILAHARQEAERLRVKMQAEIEETLKRREAQAVDRIGQAEAAAAAEVRAVASDVAVAAARQVIAANLDKDRAKTLVDQAINDLPAKLH